MADHVTAGLTLVPPVADSHAPPTKPRRKPALLRDADLLQKIFWTVPETAFMCRVGVRTVWRELSDPKSKFPRAHRTCGRTLLSRDEVLAHMAEASKR